MPKGNVEFKKRLKSAVEKLAETERYLPVKSVRLYSPVWRDRQYRWATLMDSDGTLLRERRVASSVASLKQQTVLLIGVVIQSEFSTSGTKPNPLGKAAVGNAPRGVWVDLKGGARRRLDRLFVLFVLSEAKAYHLKKAFVTTEMNVRNASEAFPDVDVLIVPRGISKGDLVSKLRAKARRWLTGAGRPRS